MTVALAVWNGRISPVFDVSRQLLLLEVQDRAVVRRHPEPLPDGEPLHKAVRLAEMEVHTLICGAVSRPLVSLLAVYGLQVIPFIAGEVEEVIAAFLDGALPNPAMAMPGCCGTGWGRARRAQSGRGTGPVSGGWGSRACETDRSRERGGCRRRNAPGPDPRP